MAPLVKCDWCDGTGHDPSFDASDTSRSDLCDGCMGTGELSGHVPGQPLAITIADAADAVPNLPEEGWRDLMELGQLLHDLRISDTNKLMRALGAVWIEEGDTGRGKFDWGWKEYDDRTNPFGQGDPPEEAKEPQMTSRRRAILAQRNKKSDSG